MAEKVEEKAVEKAAQQKFMMTVPDPMYKFLVAEMRARGLDSVQETVRQIISQAMLGKAKN